MEAQECLTGQPPEIEKRCDKHGPFTARWLSYGNEYSGCAECNNEWREEQVEKERQKMWDNQVASCIKGIGAPARYEGRRFANYRAETPQQQAALRIVKAYAERFEDRLRAGGGLVMSGGVGTGKTHLAIAMARKIARTGRTVRYTTLMEAVRDVKSTWNRDSFVSEKEAIHEFFWPDLLILDEVGVQRGTESEALITFELINRRYNAMRPTVLISNLPLPELENLLGDRVIDRMREGGGAVISFDWDSYRDRVAEDADLPVRDVSHPIPQEYRPRGVVV